MRNVDVHSCCAAWHGGRYIRATIRADNALGLRYYRGLRFVDHSV